MLTLTRQEAKSVSLLTQDERLAKIKETLSAERWVDHGPAGKIKETLKAVRWVEQSSRKKGQRSTVLRRERAVASSKVQVARIKRTVILFRGCLIREDRSRRARRRFEFEMKLRFERNHSKL
ncbi:hypothetical protein V512_008605 [Mesotoga sp. Brook.08.105.5.1]|nr:hypothetical protein RJ60_05550 [Mesotoga sp. B105.6.4]PVD16976.1 hypothetical protein V512_008605 [Mesotoga sp. Brook.08.105.5.1]RAO95555.1 hypothetical protein M388_06010 [Mesotoga sp. Brook.08.YT.4.2.5.4.]RDI93459.1 hypothetical protein Q502_05695 [Mesotoga sp. Brook.08.YT.4.2.5.2.]